MDELVAGAKELNIALSADQVALFMRYQELLMEWNQRINLTAVRDPDLIQRRHFLDSLTCSLAMGDMNGQALVDVGSGAGFPGLPLRIVCPKLKLTLLESIGKKADFLRAVIEDLHLGDVQIISARAEKVGQMKKHRERYDWAVARAVAPLSVLAEYLLPLVRLGGFMLAQKGRHVEEEMNDAEEGIAILGGGNERVLPVLMPGQDDPSHLIVIEKIRLTPDKYPRRTGVPKKRPL